MTSGTGAVRELGDRVWATHWEDVYVAYWGRAYSAPLLRTAAGIIAEMQQKHAGRVVVFSTMRVADISMKDARNEETRAAGEEMARYFEGRVRAQASVLEGTGFVAAAIRSAAVGLQLLVKNTYQVKIFDEHPPAAAWLLKQRAPGAAPLDAAVLLSMMETLRAKAR